MTITATPRPNMSQGQGTTGKPRLWGNLGFQVAVSIVLAKLTGEFEEPARTELPASGDLI